MTKSWARTKERILSCFNLVNYEFVEVIYRLMGDSRQLYCQKYPGQSMGSYTTKESTSSMDNSQKATLPKGSNPANCLSIVLSGRGGWSCESVSLKHLCIPPVRMWIGLFLVLEGLLFWSKPAVIMCSLEETARQHCSLVFLLLSSTSPAQNFHANSAKSFPSLKQLQTSSPLYLSKDLLFPTHLAV